MKQNNKKRLLAAILLAVFLPAAGCGMVLDKFSVPAHATDLMEGFQGKAAVSARPSEAFFEALQDFSLRLFQQANGEENPLLSPLSVLLALGMTANGAAGTTLAAFEDVLGGGLPLAQINEGLFWLSENLPSTKEAKLSLANALWVRDDVAPLPAFLQANADYYNAAAYRSNFSDPETLKTINSWVKSKTDGQIDKILDEIRPDVVMILINALSFDAKWAKPYEEIQIREGEFTNLSGGKSAVTMMHGDEETFLADEDFTGFVKPYAEGYSFVALLPRNEADFEGQVNALSGARFAALLANAKMARVNTVMPKFSLSFDIFLNDALDALGLGEAFTGNANFSRMLDDRSVAIDEVIHKTKIDLDEAGTKAGAVTAVIIRETSFQIPDETVELNRPFVYAIVENDTNLPVFIGAVTDLSQGK